MWNSTAEIKPPFKNAVLSVYLQSIPVPVYFHGDILISTNTVSDSVLIKRDENIIANFQKEKMIGIVWNEQYNPDSVRTMHTEFKEIKP